MPPKIKAKRYAVIDIETTGGMIKRDKITEIAILIYNGETVEETYDTLINPERSIPPQITQITGITNEMVADAPRFYEVAKKIVEITEGCVFVAHNVNFDYGFIKREFETLGFTYTRKQLCTVRLFRKAFPGLRSYSLGNLIRHFGIKVNARHRAYDDAAATTELLEMALEQDYVKYEADLMINRGIKGSRLPETIDMEELHQLPETAGVYYFMDTTGRIVYIGKSINIKKRVMQHFSKITQKSEKMMRRVASIDCVETGSELIALLQESEEIKKYKPEINKAQRNKEYPYFAFRYIDEDGYINFKIEKRSIKREKGKDILTHFSSLNGGRNALSRIRDRFALCEHKMDDRGRSDQACLYYRMHECQGACINEEIPEEYNERAEEASQHLKGLFDDDFIVVVQGRSDDERAVILVEDRHYRGYGYMQVDDLDYGTEEIKESIDYKMTTIEANSILSNYLFENKGKYQVIAL